MTRKTLALVAAMMAVTGCTLRNTDQRRKDSVTETVFEKLGISGQVIEPKRCTLRVAILPRPFRDKVVNDSIWAAADEQAIPPDARRVLEANGLRFGVLTGGLPADVEAALRPEPPNRIDPAEFNLPDGAHTLVSLTETRVSATVLVNRDGVATGKDYQDATGWLRLTAGHDGPTGVNLRVVPELHHGPVVRRYDALPSGGTINPMQFAVKDGQLEETYRELAASLTLQPGQIAVIGNDPERRGSLGAFLFTQPETGSDRLLQKVLIIWATRTNPGTPGSQPKPPADLQPVDPPDLMTRKDPPKP
jgi:hypothetical protein